MCGLCGFTGNQFNDEQNTVINQMTDAIKHRGPDSLGIHADDEVTLGFRRLAFMDLEGGGQPLYNEDKTLALVCKGEIYNHDQLRQDLQAKGHVFSTQSDVEVLLHLYEEHGVQLLDHLRGMFAFVLYDFANQQLFAARDHFGIKPLYYTVLDGQFVFGSEIKAILQYPGMPKQLNELALEQYLTFQFSVLPETFFKGIFKLLPAHYLLFKNGEVTTHEYWDAMFTPDENATLEELADELERAATISVNRHELNDKCIGSFLSSGVDSSYIVATSNVQKTFTVGFDTGSHYNETTYAKALSDELGIEHHSKLISADEYFAALPGIQYHTDEPLADPAVMALHFVSVVAREHVRCVFSGEGPDEFFGGYHIYREPISLRHLTHLPKPLRKCLAWLARNLLPVGMKGRDFFIRGGMTVEERFVGNAKIFDDHERRKLLLRPTGASYTDVTAPYFARVQHLDDITKMQYVDIKLWLDGDILQGADKVPMSHSLEVRTPLLDKEIFAVAAKVPAKYRVSKTETKIVFRRAAQRKLPESVAQKRKLGFPVPIRVWLREDKYAAMVQAEFEGDTARQYFDTAALVKLIAQHRAGKFDHSRKIWTVYTFLLWHRAYF